MTRTGAVPSVMGILCGLALGTADANAEEESYTREPGVRVERAGRFTRLDAVLPGALVSYVVPRRADGSRDLVVLVAPGEGRLEEQTAGLVPGGDGGSVPSRIGRPDAITDERRGSTAKTSMGIRPALPPCPDARPSRPLALYRVETGAVPGLTPIHTDLPADATAVDAADLDGDGSDELILARPGGLFQVTEGGLELLVQDAELAWESLHPRAIRSQEGDGQPQVTLSGMGELRLYGPREAHQRWGLLAEIALPMEGSVAAGGLRISSPAPSLIGQRGDGTLLLATRPEALGPRRLRTLLLELRPWGEAMVTECWMRFPTPEEMLDHSFLILDGQPVLFVTTRRADKMSLLTEKEIRLFPLEPDRSRLFPLEPDRSRLGNDPMFAMESQMNIWQAGKAMLRDVNGDGIDDLVIGYWKGLMDDRIVLDAYVRDADGRFPRSPRTTAFDVEDGDRSFLEYGADLNGDGLADLVLQAGDLVHVYPGLRSSNGKRLVDKQPIPIPMWSQEGDPRFVQLARTGGGTSPWRLPSIGERPWFIDLDGDGKSEMLFVRRGNGRSPGVVRAIWLDRSG